MKQAPMRMNGQMYWASQSFELARGDVKKWGHSSFPANHLETAADEEMRNVPISSNQPRDALEQLAGVADDHLQHPRAGDHERAGHADQLRDERQRHLVDLRRGLEHADQRDR